MTKAMRPRISAFMKKVWKFHAENRRDLPWRTTKDPYKILLSELMLQQTQVPRVLGKYAEFLARFPDLRSVSEAHMTDILRTWKGLGYDRRAYFIKKIADALAMPTSSRRKSFSFPSRYEELIALPGIGQSTGGALVAFCFAKQTGEKIAFIETNIRSVFIHEFFSKNKSEKIRDADIVELLGQCLQSVEPEDIREFYYALYDYGTWLKGALGKEKTSLHKRSAHYAKQSAFKGSVREMRSRILSVLLEGTTVESASGAAKGSAARPVTQTRAPNIEKEELFAAVCRSMKVPMTREELGRERIRFDTAIERLAKDGSVSVSSAMSNGRKRDIIGIC